MLTKYLLHIGDKTHELTSADIPNWEEIQCAYTRKDYDGVVRSFTSKFEFTGTAYDLLFNLYLKNGVEASASLTICTLNDQWGWDERFGAPLDFSTIKWDGSVLSISAVDNSLAALISANKSTKYEFAIDTDIESDGTLYYDRVTMKNTAVHEIMSNIECEDASDSNVYLAPSTSGARAPMYVVGDTETFENNPILIEDETEDAGSYMLSVVGDVDELTVESDIWFNGDAYPSAVDFYRLQIGIYMFDSDDTEFSTSNHKTIGMLVNTYNGSAYAMTYVGLFESVEALKEAYPNPAQNCYAFIGTSTEYEDVEACYITPVTNIAEKVQWMSGVFTNHANGHRSTAAVCTMQRHIFKYTARNVKAGTRIGVFYEAQVNTGAVTSDGKTTVDGTLISIPIYKSEIKTSWSSRGTTIPLDVLTPKNVAQCLLDKMTGQSIATSVHISDYDTRLADTYILAAESIRDIPGAKFYSSFNEFCDWMQTVFGYVYYLGEETDDGQDVYFCHRDELFAGEQTKEITYCRELNYSVDASSLYSNIEVGYDKQDYDSQCGRDEWNFYSSYTTGITVKDKKLTLKSKYRADCYGMEFLAQERSNSDADDESDNDVFFVLAKKGTADTGNCHGTSLVLARTVKIKGALSDTVFNGEFSPYYCIKANEGFLASMKQPMNLIYASTEGNSDIIIDGISVQSNITLANPIFTMGELEFSTDDADVPADINCLVEITDNDVTYRGFVKELDIKYARSEATKYKLIVKEIVV